MNRIVVGAAVDKWADGHPGVALDEAERASLVDEVMSVFEWWEPIEKSAVDRLVPAMKDSAVSAVIVPPDDTGFDVKLALETGAAVMLDKPFVLVCFDGRKPNGNFTRLARRVIDMREGDEAAIARRIEETLDDIAFEDDRGIYDTE